MRPVNWSNPINHTHPLNRGLYNWWLNAPSRRGGTVWRDLARRNDANFNNMDISVDWQGTAGRHGAWGSINLDGVSAYMQVDNPPHISERTAISAWIRPRAFASAEESGIVIHRALSGGAANNRYHFILDADKKLHFILFQGSGVLASATGTTVFAVDRWYHVVGSYDGVNVRVYVEGVREASSAGTGNMNNDLAWDVRFGWSNSLSAGGHDLDGLIDDVRIYSRGLNDTEPMQLNRLSRTGYPGLLNRVARRAVKAAAAPVGGNPWHYYAQQAAGAA